jgi:ABC-type transport system involved in multi-copper enzyme maturation permease subunit
MSRLKNISSVAKYESKLLMRSWFYRIFLVLAVLFLCIFNFAALVSEDGGGFWLMKAIPSNIPYLNLLLLNTGQAVIAVFLSSEFLKSDKKLDTSEVFYVHPLSNAEYVAGKIWGNLSVFLRLDLLIIAIVVVFNIVSGVKIDWIAYLIYFLIICIPTLIYIFGLSIGLMLILKNQAITFVLLLGYIGLTLFYIQDKYYFLFDYMVYSLPLVKSTIIGFTNLYALINHRLIYLLLGIGFICLSIFLFRRLPNTKYGRYKWLVLSICFLIAGLIAAFNHVSSILNESRTRNIFTEVNNKYVHLPKMIVDNYDISIEQRPDNIISEVIMKAYPLEKSKTFAFCLNPSLKIIDINSGNNNITFKRDKQIIVTTFDKELSQGDTVTIKFKYEGTIDGLFCYLDIPPEILQEEYTAAVFFHIDKKYVFQENNYLLFTPETYWYPRPGTSYSSTSPDWQQAYFSNFSLKVKTLPGLKALSQGTIRETDTENEFLYNTDFPSPSVTLIVGDYEQKSIVVDSVMYSIWNIKGNDYFSSVFDSIIDTIPAQIREKRRWFESTYSLDYSFKRFSVIEVPVQFNGYARAWTQSQEMLQPEMVLFPEKGGLFDEADAGKRAKNEKKWAKWNGQEISDKEASIRALNAFLGIFQRTESTLNWSQDRGAFNITTKANPYFLFPQLYNFRFNIFSSEWSIANRLIELYLQDKSDNNNWMRQMNGISNNEKANLLMEKKSFKELLSDTEQRNLLDNIISLKANYLFAPAERNTGTKEFRDSLRNVLKNKIFTNLNFENFLDTLEEISKTDLKSPIQKWNSLTPLPVYIIGEPEITQITNRDKEVFVAKMQLKNDSDNDGIVKVTTNFGGRNVVYDPRTIKNLLFKPHETIQLISVWEEAPRNITVNTLISANLPNSVNIPLNNIIRERNKTIDTEGEFFISSTQTDNSHEIIVDNEDSTLFVLSSPDIVGLLPKWLDDVGDNSFKYSGVSNWRPPIQWTLTTNEKYYGRHARSAYVIKSGSGNQTATWKIAIPSSGQYDLYYYVYKPDDLRRRGGGGGDGRRGGGSSESEYSFLVQYDNSEEKAFINLRRANEGWSLLGTYYFSEDTVRVILSNDCKLRSVTADAVRVVKR